MVRKIERLTPEQIATGLTPNDRKAILADGMNGLSSEAQIDRFVRSGLLTEFDVPALAGWADDPAYVEMRRLGIALVAHSWTEVGDQVRTILTKQND